VPGQAGEGAVRNGDIRHPVGKHCGITIREFAFINNKVVCLGDISIDIQADAICFTGVVRNAELAVVKLNIVDERVFIAICFNIHTAREGQSLKGNVAPLLTDPVTNVIVFGRTHVSVSNKISAVPLCAVDLPAECNQPVDGHRRTIGCLEGNIAHIADILTLARATIGVIVYILLDGIDSGFGSAKVILGIAARICSGTAKLDLVIVACT